MAISRFRSTIESIMISRLDLIGTSGNEVSTQSKARPRRSYLSGWLILGSLTAIFLAWLLFRWLIQPTWPGILPNFLRELSELTQIAAAVTLLVLWAGLLWRHYRRTPATPFQVLSLEELFELSPKGFEHYVADLFRQKGYKVTVRGRSGDHGVDLELIGDGYKKAIVQCKRYRDTVGEKIIRDLYGTLLHERVSRAFLVTTADISSAARRWAEGKPITLVDGQTLVEIASSLAERIQTD